MRIRLAGQLVLGFTLGLLLALSACPPQCKTGLTLCGEQCLDLLNDVTACGTCATVCAAGASCSDGGCGCPTGQVVCNGRCVDLGSSALHCGACNHGCGLGTCQGGACVCNPGASHCPGLERECVDLQADPDHCGGCATPCLVAASACDAGTCGCPPQRPDVCGNTCTSTLTDRANCGGCGAACPGSNQLCDAGSCACPATTPSLCGSLCVDTQTSAAHCGGCGRACAQGQTCSAGACACPSGQTACPLPDGGAACTNLLGDPRNCNQCGRACPDAGTCQAGTCGCPAAAPVVCGQSSTSAGACCPGNGCCGGTPSTCQVTHDNGLGQSFYDCLPRDTFTAAQARAAALAWSPNGAATIVDPTFNCGTGCLCVLNAPQNATRAAVFCYASTFTGYVATTELGTCTAATCPSLGAANTFQWH